MSKEIAKTTSGRHIADHPEYRQFIKDLKTRVVTARISAARAVNRDLILLYWDIGRAIAERQESLGWGESVVEMVAKDLNSAFPKTTGFSSQNVWRMLQFFRTHTDDRFLAQLVREMVASVPWVHHANALAKLPTPPPASMFII